MTDEISQADTAFKEFIKQFGENDVIKDIFLDLFLEAIYGTDDIPVSGEARQEQYENPQQTGIGNMPTYEIE